MAKTGDMSAPPMYGAGARAVEGNPVDDIRYIRITDITDGGKLGDSWMTADEIESKYLLQSGDLLFARSGATVGKTLLYDDSMGRALFAGYLIKFELDDSVVLPRFAYHCVNTSRYWDWVALAQGGGAQPNIGAKEYAKFEIPVPPLEEQERIVGILDKFDALVNDIGQGIPAEIEARRKQYAYYRDKLLSFPEKVA